MTENWDHHQLRPWRHDHATTTIFFWIWAHGPCQAFYSLLGTEEYTMFHTLKLDNNRVQLRAWIAELWCIVGGGLLSSSWEGDMLYIQCLARRIFRRGSRTGQPLWKKFPGPMHVIQARGFVANVGMPVCRKHRTQVSVSHVIFLAIPVMGFWQTDRHNGNRPLKLRHFSNPRNCWNWK